MGFGPDDAPDGSYGTGNYGGARGPRGMALTHKTPAFTKRSKYDHDATVAYAKNLLAAMVSPHVSVQDVMDQEAARKANPNYGQGFYGHGVTQMGLQDQHNLSLLGSAAGLFAPGLNYPDAQALGNTMTSAPVNYPGRPTVDNQGNPIGSLESQSFNATNPGEWDFPISSSNTQLGNMPEDFDLSNYFTETAESGQEFDQQAAMAALEPSTLVDASFVPQVPVVSAGIVPGSNRIVGGQRGRGLSSGWDASDFAKLSGEEQADAQTLMDQQITSEGGGEALIPRKKRAYIDAFTGVRPKKKRNIYQDSASMGWW